jgi:hypothetical protein
VATVDGSGASSVFTIIGSKAIVTLNGMTIRNGLAPGTGTVTPTEGGGVFFTSTKHRKLLIENSVIRDNVASYGAGVDVAVTGPRLLTSDATITGTTISFNDAGIPPGSVPVLTQGGGIFVGASKLRMTNSTISNNSSSGPGGQTAAIGNHQGEVTLNNVTIADNTAAGFIGGVEVGTKTMLSNTILTDNTDASGESDCSDGLTSKDYNTVRDTKCAFNGETDHDIVGNDPMLAPLADNGGPLAPDTPPETRAFLGPLALGAGNPGTPNGKKHAVVW